MRIPRPRNRSTPRLSAQAGVARRPLAGVRSGAITGPKQRLDGQLARSSDRSCSSIARREGSNGTPEKRSPPSGRLHHGRNVAVGGPIRWGEPSGKRGGARRSTAQPGSDPAPRGEKTRLAQSGSNQSGILRSGGNAATAPATPAKGWIEVENLGAAVLGAAK